MPGVGGRTLAPAILALSCPFPPGVVLGAWNWLRGETSGEGCKWGDGVGGRLVVWYIAHCLSVSGRR